MASFQTITLIIAIVILLILLIVIGINIGTAQSKMPWPPVVGDCPDYWLDIGVNGSQCVVNINQDNKGKATSPMDFSGSTYQGSGAACAKYTWANTNNVSWDGITYGVTNPCAKLLGS